jgi:hypothetical protein
MERRHFLKIFLGTTAGISIASCDRGITKKINPFSNIAVNEFDITIHSNMDKGHAIFSQINELPITELVTETLIVGGGIAGLSAAYKARNKDFILCEIDDSFGGSSSAINLNGKLHAQGAHYDLAYPNNYGSEVLELLKELNIIEYNPNSSLWEFVEKQHLISSENEVQCWYNGQIRTSVIPEGKVKKNFLSLLEPYLNKMVLPTRLIDSKYSWLNDISFYDYLYKYLDPDAAFISAIDYQMIDDYGAPSKSVSALAGIHYYTCRPYYDEKQHIELFSPPEGNFYFVQKLISAINNNKALLNQHLVFSISQTSDGVTAKVLDIANNSIKLIKAKNAIYAGQKHALKFINKDLFKAYEFNRYSPWFVINIELKEPINTKHVWQNDFINNDMTFLGFVNSKAQSKEDKQVLTAYFCYPEKFRNTLKDFSAQKEHIINTAVKNISGFYQLDISPLIEKIHVKLMGHAMPIPFPGYIKNNWKKNGNIAFAGVDTGRLPLFFEAMDSGIVAYEELNS